MDNSQINAGVIAYTQSITTQQYIKNFELWQKAFVNVKTLSDTLSIMRAQTIAANELHNIVATMPSEYRSILKQYADVQARLDALNSIVTNTLNNGNLTVEDKRDFLSLISRILQSILKSKQFKEIPAEIIKDLCVQIFMILIGAGSGGTENIDNSTHVSIINNINNEIPVDISSTEINVYKKATFKSKCTTMDSSTEYYIVKKYRTWMVISYIDKDGNWDTGFVNVKDLE